MEIRLLIKELREKASRTGCFVVRSGESLNTIVDAEQVPTAAGVYIVYAGLGVDGDIVYIGKSGTMNNDGTLGGQRLNGRLKGQQRGIPREDFYKFYMEKHSLDGLCIEWIETFCRGNGALPGYVEAKLIQAHFDEYKRLPDMNLKF